MSCNLLRTCFVQYTRPTTSTSPLTVTASLHSSAPVHAESQRKRSARMTRQRNLEKRVQIQQRAEENRPHVVLGTKAGDEEKWTTSDLARVLVKPEELKPIPWEQKIPFEAKTDAEGREVLRKLQTVGGDEVVTPKAFSYGITEPEKNLLFNHLPYLNAEFRTNFMRETKRVTATSSAMQVEFLKNVRQNTAKASMLARVVDLVNANKGGIMYENRRRVIEEFSEDGKKNDTGRPEVQAALLTLQIRNLWEHLSKCKRDIANRRSLRILIHKRAKILKYLKRLDRDRYDRVLERLALEPGSVEGELIV